MSELLKLLYEQPKKLRLLILNFLKLILTIIILNGIHGLFKYNFLKNITGFNGSNHIGEIFVYLILFIAYWLVIWYVLEPFFVLLIGLKKRRAQENQDENQRAEDKKGIGTLLKFFGGFTIENKNFVVPNDNIHTLAEIAQFVDEDNSFNAPNTLFGEALYILFVGWMYLIFNSEYCGMSLCNHALIGSAILLLILLYRFLNNLFVRLKDHTADVRIFLDELEFRKMVMDIVLKDFSGYLNLEKESFDLNWGKNGYHIRDLYHYNEGLGNAYYLKRFRKKSRPDLSDMVMILNFNPNEELRTVLKEMKVIGIVIAEDDSELIDKLIVELNRLKGIKELS
ncbi:hypothetical protein [Fluviicola taffensis]|uniref:hypothetical protein n=1 Tax=Fluviicola taffensis TaxID=191579 RepID=UPI003137EA03